MGNCQHGSPSAHDFEIKIDPAAGAHKIKGSTAEKTETSFGPAHYDEDPFKVGSALLPGKLDNMTLREGHPDKGYDGSLSTSTSPTMSAVTTSSDVSERADYKSLYEESLKRIRELEEDNTELKCKQVEIRTAKELYLNIFEHFPALIWRARLDKQCDYFNQTWLEWTGQTLEHEFGFGWTEGVHKDDFDRCLKIYTEAFDKHEPFYMEYRLMHKSGEYRWIGDHGTPFKDLDGSFLGYIGSCYDITEQRDIQQKLKELNATKDKFFGILAHDLRNPIATFVTVAELLKDSEDFAPEEMAEIADEMHKDAKNTLGLLEHVLEWARAQESEIQFNPQPIEAADLLRDAVGHVDLCAKAKKINISLGLSDMIISVDKNMLITVLRNLLMNAIKFTHSGGEIKLEAKWDYDDVNPSDVSQASKAILLTITDNGVGMDQEQLDSLFQLKASSGRVQREGTNNEKGSGLGLIICNDFIATHQGRIWAQSPGEKGTQIMIRIPQP